MDLSARINEILRAHRLVSAGPARIRCKCGDGLDGRDAYLAYDAHAAALILAAIEPLVARALYEQWRAGRTEGQPPWEDLSLEAQERFVAKARAVTSCQ